MGIWMDGWVDGWMEMAFGGLRLRDGFMRCSGRKHRVFGLIEVDLPALHTEYRI
ncbi:uncharacterized protein K452DRAFT_282036 [Aplosporella prunicola CBS 121167]|uniref:Uncharacterized protein n=1 Tax=Aplosporella prunicola CBS 121167 TaxID=1176127 RepID=A0A6A6BSJ5_9PEZI|nr:uncharacterized protein K452DRAFT_282036 [Aplosporella prunicola CBS 121167]KAF2147056.1 hypothetical protein K452DRAFT_282036 [Aplosporella prunicola CBS 121167]